MPFSDWSIYLSIVSLEREALNLVRKSAMPGSCSNPSSTTSLIFQKSRPGVWKLSRYHFVWRTSSKIWRTSSAVGVGDKDIALIIGLAPHDVPATGRRSPATATGSDQFGQQCRQVHRAWARCRQHALDRPGRRSGHGALCRQRYGHWHSARKNWSIFSRPSPRPTPRRLDATGVPDSAWPSANIWSP